LCNAEEQADDLVAALRNTEGAYVQWKRLQRGRGGLRRLQESRLPLYEQTSLDMSYCSQVVPGQLGMPEVMTEQLTHLAEISSAATPSVLVHHQGYNDAPGRGEGVALIVPHHGPLHRRGCTVP
jgi:hypothetical protein